MDIAVQRGVAYVDAFSCKQSYLPVLRHAEVIFQAKQTGKQFRGRRYLQGFSRDAPSC